MYSSDAVLAFIQIVICCSNEDYDFDDNGKGHKRTKLIEDEATALFGSHHMLFEIENNIDNVCLKFYGDSTEKCEKAIDELLKQSELEYTKHSHYESFPETRFVFLLAQQK